MLYKWVREIVGKYSFIVDTKFTGGIFYIYYEKNKKRYVKRLPYRATKSQLEHVISIIKEEIDYDKTHAEYWGEKIMELKREAEPILIGVVGDESEDK